ncbi:thioredoxin domain-containing protein [Vibrio ishigakensis]|uniref:hypothetical protein n=1 Tax=Vibrio ishigakensis TaxID=1481914 RepID=UPI0021C4A8D8|nr:hypothetical protein [Vibrio ishigakensis]
MRHKLTSALLLLGVSNSVLAFDEGVHYELVKQPEIENSILVFHSPYCGACSLVHKPLEKTAMSLGVDFIEVPVKFGKPLDATIQHAFVLASYEGKGSQFSRQLMKQIRRSHGRLPSDAAGVKKILEANGVNSSKLFEEQVTRDVALLNDLAKDYGINKTPSIYVSGNKRIKLGSLRSVSELNKLIKHLNHS